MILNNMFCLPCFDWFKWHFIWFKKAPRLISTLSLFTLAIAVSQSTVSPQFTFQVQVLGSIDALAGCRGVDLQRVGVAVVPGDDHVVPLVVIEGHVALALDEVGAVPQVKHVVDVPGSRDRTRSGPGWRKQ